MAKCHAGWSLQGQVGQTESSSPLGSRQQARSCLPLTSRGWLVAALPRCPAKGEGLGTLAPRALWASGHTWRPAGTEANTCSETAAMLRPRLPERVWVPLVGPGPWVPRPLRKVAWCLCVSAVCSRGEAVLAAAVPSCQAITREKPVWSWAVMPSPL